MRSCCIWEKTSGRSSGVRRIERRADRCNLDQLPWRWSRVACGAASPLIVLPRAGRMLRRMPPPATAPHPPHVPPRSRHRRAPRGWPPACVRSHPDVPAGAARRAFSQGIACPAQPRRARPLAPRRRHPCQALQAPWHVERVADCWAAVAWNLGWLVALPILSPGDLYFPVLHHPVPLLVGIALLRR
jgi:hypothetical protein